MLPMETDRAFWLVVVLLWMEIIWLGRANQIHDRRQNYFKKARYRMMMRAYYEPTEYERELLRAEELAQDVVKLLKGENYSFAVLVLKKAEETIQERAIIQEDL